MQSSACYKIALFSRKIGNLESCAAFRIIFSCLLFKKAVSLALIPIVLSLSRDSRTLYWKICKSCKVKFRKILQAYFDGSRNAMSWIKDPVFNMAGINRHNVEIAGFFCHSDFT